MVRNPDAFAYNYSQTTRKVDVKPYFSFDVCSSDPERNALVTQTLSAELGSDGFVSTGRRVVSTTASTTRS